MTVTVKGADLGNDEYEVDTSHDVNFTRYIMGPKIGLQARLDYEADDLI